MAGHGLQYNLSFDGSSPQQPLYNVTHQSVIFKTFSRHVVVFLFLRCCYGNSISYKKIPFKFSFSHLWVQ